jgi:hypothetical protein
VLCMLCSIRGEPGSTCDLLLCIISEIIGSYGSGLTYWLWSTGVDGGALLLPSLTGEQTWFIGGASAATVRNNFIPVQRPSP